MKPIEPARHPRATAATRLQAAPASAGASPDAATPTSFLRTLAQASAANAQQLPALLGVTPSGFDEPRAAPSRPSAEKAAKHGSSEAGTTRLQDRPLSATSESFELDDQAVSELASSTPRGPDPLGLSEAVRQDMTATSQKVAPPEGRTDRNPGGSKEESSQGPRTSQPSNSKEAGAQGQHSQSADSAGSAGSARSTPDAAAKPGAPAPATTNTTATAKAAAGNTLTLGPLAAAGAARAAGVMPPAAQTTTSLGAVSATGRRDALVARRIDIAKPTHAPKQTGEPAALQASRAIAAALKTGDKSLILRMTPDHLGEVRVELSVKEGKVSASFQAATEAARDLLVDSSDVLRLALEARGLHVEKLDFAVTDHGVPPGADAPNWTEAGFGGAGADSGGAAEENAARSAPEHGPRNGPGDPGPPEDRGGQLEDADARSVLVLGVDAVA